MFAKYVQGLTLLSLSMSVLPGPVLAARFADVPSDLEYSVAIEALAAKGIVGGQGNGALYAPASPINRAEFLKIVMNTKGQTEQTGSDCFPDVKNEWFAPYICRAKAQNVISGYPDGTFRPDKNVTFVEAAKILSIAFSQQPQGAFGEWYEGYANALEESKAIPPSITRLDAALTRAEMAEMLWRIMDKKTGQPSKAVLNLKYPELNVRLSGDDPVRAASCSDLHLLTKHATNWDNTMYYRDDIGGARGVPMPAALMEKSADTTTRVGNGSDHSNTNVQVEGVDEADIVKTDGTHLFIVRNNEKSRVTIVQAKPANAMKEVASIDLTNLGISAKDIYVDNGKLTIIGTSFMNDVTIMNNEMNAKMMIWPPVFHTQKTAVAIYDVRVPAKPKQLRVLKFDGSDLSTRRIQNKLYLVLRPQANYWEGPMPLTKSLSESNVPTFEDSKTGITKPMASCNDVLILPRVPTPSYLAVAVIRLDDTSKDVQTEVVLGNADNVYASLDNLYIATTRYSYDWNPMGPSTSQEQTHIYRFAFTDDGVRMEAQGKVPGHLLNQFAMDQNGDYFRAATTISPTWGLRGEESHAKNGLYVLNRAMENVGQIENIAPGETIYAARFMGKRAYLVTFKQVDPFFVIDLSNPRAPKILGQLKIPGYSNYLHPYDDNHVIGIGKEVDESIDADKVHSDDAVYYTAIQGVKLSMFDVTDVSNPKEMHKVVLGDRGTETPVTSDHKALLFEKERGLLALPILVTKRPAGSEKSADGSPVFQGAYVYGVSLTKGFEQLGNITQYDDPQIFLKAGGYWYDQGSDIQRIVRIGDSLISISQNGVKSSSLPGLQEEGKMTFAK